MTWSASSPRSTPRSAPGASAWTRAQEYTAPEGLEAKEYQGNTTHFSIVDKDGNMIAQTQTVRSYWGSSVMCDGYGFIMNNAMSDFSAKVGVLTTQGLSLWYGQRH